MLAVGVVIVATACGEGERPCTPSSEGYGDATSLVWTSLLEMERAEGPCRPRVELYATGADLRRAADEVQIQDLPFVDFTRERVVLREAPAERGLTWVARRGDKVTIGTQACAGNTPAGCGIHLYKVTTTEGATIDEHVCAPLQCAGVQSDPAGGGI
ncbi:MAG: hypothetical protein JST00_28225 [Deltaproteobacteria bacterium]|nr:hypothetical protein [Deltaproteobacteria bacterium]